MPALVYASFASLAIISGLFPAFGENGESSAETVAISIKIVS
jgi:hypothetical protein